MTEQGTTEQKGPSVNDSSPEQSIANSPVETTPPIVEAAKVAAEPNRPALHIDIQVHIDPTSSAELIDQIFASMAKHLYRYES